MNINDILTEIEYTKERSAEELFEFVKQKEKELSVWSGEHSGTKTLREMKHRELDKELFDKFAHELAPFAYFAKNFYGDAPNAMFKPCYGSEQYDGIIANNNKKIFVEITNAIVGWKWGLQKELLIEKGCSPWEHGIHGVQGNKTKRNRSASDIKTSNELVNYTDRIRTTIELVKEKTNNKCKKSMEQKLPYGRNKTILIVTFDDTGFSENVWNDFVYFKQAEIDSMEHNFIKTILFGWISKKFIPENL